MALKKYILCCKYLGTEKLKFESQHNSIRYISITVDRMELKGTKQKMKENERHHNSVWTSLSFSSFKNKVLVFAIE